MTEIIDLEEGKDYIVHADSNKRARLSLKTVKDFFWSVTE